jgi:hypothetical protein
MVIAAMWPRHQEQTMFEDFKLIHRYTRAQAISDGVLIDVSETASEAGFRFPVALTAGAWSEAVTWNEHDTETTGIAQDEAGRLWDVLWMARFALHALRDASVRRAPFTLLRVPRGGRRATRFTLDIVVGPGDEGEPVLTVCLQDED